LKQLFSSPLYAGCASEKGCHRSGSIRFSDHRYWVPLIALFSGMRLGEIAQLDTECVREEEGVLLFDVNRDDGKTVKTANSIRVVPVHTQLIHLGLPSFVGKRKAAGAGRLFPELVRNARGQVAGDYSRDFNRFLAKVGISGVSFHSFRHGVADALRRAGYLDNQVALILGHSREKTTSSRYGAIAPGTIKLRKEMVDSIKYDGVQIPESSA
jgi:integrase